MSAARALRGDYLLVGERLLYAAALADLDIVDRIWERPHAMTIADNAARSVVTATARIWWETHFLDGPDGILGFTSLAPPEFRLSRPVGPHDVVLPLPETGTSSRTVSSRLRRWRDDHQMVSSSSATVLGQLLVRADSVLDLLAKGTRERVNQQFWDDAMSLSRTGAAQAEAELHRRFYLRLDVVSSAANLILTGLMLRVSMQQGLTLTYARGNPVDSLTAPFPDKRDAIVAEARDMGNFYYTSGNNSLKNAIGSVTLRGFYSRLYDALLAFWIAKLISQSTAVCDSGLEYTPEIAEEGVAACFAGLAWDLIELVDGGTNEEERLCIFYRDADREGAQRAVRRDTVPRNPLYPRHFLEVVDARAMALSGPKWAAVALTHLPRLEQEYNSRIGNELLLETMEREYLELAYLNAYKTLGREEDVRKHAIRLAGRIIVRKGLGL